MGKKKKQSVFWIIIFSLFGVVFIRQQFMIHRLNKEYELQMEQLKKVKLVNCQLKEEKKLTQRSDYIERLARSQLKLIKPGEVLFIDTNKQ